MVLSLRSTARGKWNKMEMLDYCSVNLETGEVRKRHKLLHAPQVATDIRTALPTGPASPAETL